MRRFIAGSLAKNDVVISSDNSQPANEYRTRSGTINPSIRRNSSYSAANSPWPNGGITIGPDARTRIERTSKVKRYSSPPARSTTIVSEPALLGLSGKIRRTGRVPSHKASRCTTAFHRACERRGGFTDVSAPTTAPPINARIALPSQQ